MFYKKSLYIFIFVGIVLNLNSKEFDNKWKKVDINMTYNLLNSNEECIDIDSSFNNLLSNVIEVNNGIDKTDANLDFNNKQIKIINLNSLYESDNNSLLFQKQINANENFYSYSTELISRFTYEKLLFGFNTFNGINEEKNIIGFGGELAYSNYFKLNSIYYKEEEIDKIRLNMEFNIADHAYLGINLNKKEDDKEYKITYSPYSILNLSYGYKDTGSNSIMLGFTFNYNKKLFKQLNEEKINQLNRYDFIDY